MIAVMQQTSAANILAIARVHHAMAAGHDQQQQFTNTVILKHSL